MAEWVEPERRPDCLAGYAGRWVAVRDRSVVVADAETPLELVGKLRVLGAEYARNSIIQYAGHPDDPIDLGWLSLPWAF